MKTILYSIIAIFIFGIIAMGFTNKANTTKSVLIQSTESNVSEAALSQSAKIISNRLRDFSNEKIDLRIIPERNQIQVTFPDNMDLNVAEKLLTQKGEIGFYKMYNRKNLPELLKDSQHLFSLLKNNDKNNLVEIGCCSISESTNVNKYLQTLEQNPTCKFVWSQPSKDFDICLFALRTEKAPLLSGADIESMQSGNDDKSFYIGINFNKPAVALWAEITKQNIGNSRAIVLENTVLAAPIVRSAIEGGKSMITGDYTQTEVKLIAALGNNGELPLSFKVIK